MDQLAWTMERCEREIRDLIPFSSHLEGNTLYGSAHVTKRKKKNVQLKSSFPRTGHGLDPLEETWTISPSPKEKER